MLGLTLVEFKIKGFKMNLWFQIICTVRLNTPITIDMPGNSDDKSEAAIGYVVAIGLSASNIVQAASKANDLALYVNGGDPVGNIVEEMHIKQAEEPEIRLNLENEYVAPDGGNFLRSGLTYFCE